MRGAEVVIARLTTPGKARDPTKLPNPRHFITTPREDFVGIGLVPDVPHNPVLRRIENVVQRNRQFDGAQVGREVAARGAHAVQDECAQLVGQCRQCRRVQLSQKVRGYRQCSDVQRSWAPTGGQPVPLHNQRRHFEVNEFIMLSGV